MYLQVEYSVLKATKEVSKAFEFYIEEFDGHYFQTSHELNCSHTGDKDKNVEQDCLKNEGVSGPHDAESVSLCTCQTPW